MLYTLRMAGSLASQRRHLLPRTPSDRVVLGVLVAGVAAASAAGVDPVVGAAPGAALALFQKVNGHVQAWRMGGVERAFVMESTAISFYVLVAVLFAAAIAEGVGLVRDVGLTWLAVGGLWIDTIVRSWRESRYV